MTSSVSARPQQLRDRDALILEHLQLVRNIARRIHERLPAFVALEDLVSSGIIGLITAVDTYQEERGVRFTTYAEYRIRGAILDSLRKLDWAPRQARKRAKAIELAVAELQQENMSIPVEHEIAGKLGISLDEYREWLVDTAGLNIGTLNRTVKDDSTATLLEFIADDEDRTPACLLEQSQMEQILNEAVAKIPAQEREILSFYYEHGLAPREIAQVTGLTANRVCQLRSQAILRVRVFVQRVLSSRRRPK